MFQELYNYLMSNIQFALLGVVICVIFFAGAYFIIYKKIMKGKRDIPFWKFFLYTTFVAYVLVVLGLTILSRESGFVNVDLHLFRSYREAWNSFSVSSWKMPMYNILMFIPLGILLPLIHKKFQNPFLMLGTGFGFSLFIESIQLIFKFGVFEADDLLNNTMGAILGYSVIMVILTILTKGRERKKKVWLTGLYAIPICLAIVTFLFTFSYYQLQELGNMTSNYIFTMNMKNVKVSADCSLSDKPEKMTIYKPASYNKESSLEFAKALFKNIGDENGEISIHAEYEKEIVYDYKGKNAYILWFYYKNGSYNLTNFDVEMGEEEDIKVNIKEKEAREKLKPYKINIPKFARYEQSGNGFDFAVDEYVKDNTMIFGNVNCTINAQSEIYSITNNLVSAEGVKEVEAMSQQQAYEKLQKGKFTSWAARQGDFKSCKVKSVSIEYHLDSKGFYQPVYVFKVTINDTIEDEILIPAIS